jgi:two-component system KDP operon response regulator KdpE
VDDEPQIRRLLAYALSRSDYAVEAVGTGHEALARLRLAGIDLVVLDLGLPDMEGFDVCRQVREWSDVPIIVVSVRDDEQDKVRALDYGADDYVTKPFSLEELLARVRANLRRGPAAAAESVISVGPLTIDLARRSVLREGHEIHLTPTEYSLLRVLAVNRGKVVTHRQLLRDARGTAYEGDTPLLRVHMAGLRRKLSLQPRSPGYISTEAGVGYRLRE